MFIKCIQHWIALHNTGFQRLGSNEGILTQPKNEQNLLFYFLLKNRFFFLFLFSKLLAFCIILPPQVTTCTAAHNSGCGAWQRADVHLFYSLSSLLFIKLGIYVLIENNVMVCVQVKHLAGQRFSSRGRWGGSVKSQMQDVQFVHIAALKFKDFSQMCQMWTCKCAKLRLAVCSQNNQSLGYSLTALACPPTRMLLFIQF